MKHNRKGKNSAFNGHYEELIKRGSICPYCGAKTVLCSGDYIGKNDGKKYYVCKNYPDCNAYTSTILLKAESTKDLSYARLHPDKYEVKEIHKNGINRYQVNYIEYIPYWSVSDKILRTLRQEVHFYLDMLHTKHLIVEEKESGRGSKKNQARFIEEVLQQPADSYRAHVGRLSVYECQQVIEAAVKRLYDNRHKYNGKVNVFKTNNDCKPYVIRNVSLVKMINEINKEKGYK